MTLLDYLKAVASPQELESLAERCGTTPAHLWQVARGYRRAGENLCINIDRETVGRIPCEQLRPDVDWAYIRGTGSGADRAA